eukprot:TRINITY_DN6498_c0_g1_i1.p1 TRINITY_DN6498_c0_g1~~TRINITY_DN6498_c0_g1_i1.p1  ORF type:complete len:362 (+),score=72.95 TRINITY_DN6498_c0_g1_i1:72-1088(+)
MPTEEEKKATSADYYFDPRARFSTHEQLIRDSVRQSCLSGCIKANKDKFNGKTVLVVGSGLGLLAMECARFGGAVKVVGVDQSAIVQKANEIAVENKIDDKVTFFQGSLLDSEFKLPLEPTSVDIILCEWVGNLLTNEPVLKELIAAREKYMKPDGTIIPDNATLHLTTCSDREYKNDSLGFWDNVYGFRMLPMKQLVLDCPAIAPIPEDQIISNTCDVATMDAYSVTPDTVALDSSYSLTSNTNRDFVHYLIAFLSIRLTKPGWKGFTLSTSPDSQTTNLQQCCFTLKEDLPVNAGDNITGRLKMIPGEPSSKVAIDVSMNGSVHSTSYRQNFELYH